MSLEHHLAEVLRSARVARGWSIRDMAEKADVAPMTVQRVEKGQPIRPDSWRGIARAFEIEDHLLVGAATREDGPARVAQALGLEHAAHLPGGRVAPHPTLGWSVDEEGRVHLAINNPHRSNYAKSVEPTPDEEALIKALNIVTKIQDSKMASAAIGPLMSLLTGSLIERNEY
jgi:transcriptional regulator with XRE-family HTH domain